MSSTKTVMTLPDLKRQNLLDKLLEKGIHTTKDGTSIYELTDKEMAHELVMIRYREKNVESSENSWF